MVCRDTLRIKHLPKELSEAQKEDFARHFGAIKVKVITSKAKEKSVVYAKFESEEIAKTILYRLHQITVLNSRLNVDYAETDILQGKPQLKKVEESDVSSEKFFKSFINKINAFNDSVGFHQPPPSHLKYNYPKANRATINNIAHALATIPRFYTQVLHLMNKLNLPPPFAMPDPPVQTIMPSQHPVLVQKLNAEVVSKRKKESSSESEMESDEDMKKNKEIVPQKRVLPQKKIVKRPRFIKAPVGQVSVTPAERVENVFDKVEVVQPYKKIELKVSSECLEPKSEQKIIPEPSLKPVLLKPVNQKAEQKIIEKILVGEQKETSKNLELSPIIVPETFQPKTMSVLTSQDQKSEILSEPMAIDNASPESPDDEYPCISLEELAANQVTDLTVMPIFKNYNPGVPTNKLYIKNCAKTVVLQDMEYIYNRYRDENTEDKPSEFNIRLMQEGRMKGQAFVTLDSIEMAQKAVKETNGFILKDKPLVVVFGKAGSKKK